MLNNILIVYFLQVLTVLNDICTCSRTRSLSSNRCTWDRRKWRNRYGNIASTTPTRAYASSSRCCPTRWKKRKRRAFTSFSPFKPPSAATTCWSVWFWRSRITWYAFQVFWLNSNLYWNYSFRNFTADVFWFAHFWMLMQLLVHYFTMLDTSVIWLLVKC